MGAFDFSININYLSLVSRIEGGTDMFHHEGRTGNACCSNTE